MPIGPGIYDAECTKVRLATGGGVIVIVTGGKRGHGFSCQLTAEQTILIPAMLRRVADEIEQSVHPRKH